MTDVIAGFIPEEIEAFLKKRDMRIFHIEANPYIDPAIKYHADMAAVFLKNKKVLLSKGQAKLKAQLQKNGYEVILSDKEPKGKYPGDVLLNVALFNNNAVGNFKYTDRALLEKIGDYIKFDVNQGYAKCSMLPLSKTALITDDESIYNSLKNTFDVLLISKGDISLDFHSYGFIGGASAKISEDEILFFGDIKKHRDYEKIRAFLEKYNMKIISFDNLPLTDYGGLVVLK